MSTPTERFMDLWLLDREDREHWDEQARLLLEWHEGAKSETIYALGSKMVEEVEHDMSKVGDLKTTYNTFLWYYLEEVDFDSIARVVVEEL